MCVLVFLAVLDGEKQSQYAGRWTEFRNPKEDEWVRLKKQSQLSNGQNELKYLYERGL